jgi:phage terminase Nu1 subunit (DNA packaging protein)
MTDEITTGELAKLFDTTPKTIADLGKRGIIEKGSNRGTWALDASVTGYCEAPTRRSGCKRRRGSRPSPRTARTRAGRSSRGKGRAATQWLVETDAVEKLWTSKLRAFRNRILGIPGRVQYLSARQTVVLQQELRAALDELADEAG